RQQAQAGAFARQPLPYLDSRYRSVGGCAAATVAGPAVPRRLTQLLWPAAFRQGRRDRAAGPEIVAWRADREFPGPPSAQSFLAPARALRGAVGSLQSLPRWPAR